MNRNVVVIFDLDGTLTEPQFDFDAIRSEIGVTGPILEALPGLSPDRREAAQAILARHEREAAGRSILRQGAVEVLQACRDRGFSTAILTRNSRESLNTAIERHALSVDATRTRDDGAIKPAAEPVLSICDELSASPKNSWMVGDYLFDVLAGNAAGTQTVLLVDDGEMPSFAGQADFVIPRLLELLGIMDSLGITDAD